MFWPSKVFGFVEPFAGMPLRRGGGNRPYYQPIRSGKLIGNLVPQGPSALLRLITNSHLSSAYATPNAYFIAANASTTGRLLTVIKPPP